MRHFSLWVVLMVLMVTTWTPGCGSDDGDSGGEESDGETADDDDVADDDSDDDTDDDAGTDDDVDDDSDDDADDDATDDDVDFPLEIGDKVPDFELLAHDESLMRLSDYLGTKVLLSTNPKANTAVCSLQMKTLDGMYEDFTSRGVIPFGVSADSHETQIEWAESCGLEDVLLLSDSDPRGYVTGMFGLFNPSTDYPNRGNAIIDEEGYLIFVEETPIAQVPDFDAILTWLDAR